MPRVTRKFAAYAVGYVAVMWLVWVLTPLVARSIAGAAAAVGRSQGLVDSILIVQVFVAVATLVTIAVIAKLSERSTERALREREYHSRLMLDGLPVGVYTTDANGFLTSYNNAAAIMWGRRPGLTTERWCGSVKMLKPNGELMPHGDCPMAQAVRTQTMVHGEEALIERPDHSRLPFIAYATPLRNTIGETIGAMNVMVDISERKRAESATLAANARYEHQAAALSALTRLSVHDAESLVRVLRIVTETVAVTLDVERASVWRMTGPRAAIACHDLFERSQLQHSAGETLPREAFPSYFAAVDRIDIIAAADARNDPRTSELAGYLQAHRIASMLDAPLHSGGVAVGVLCCEQVDHARAWTHDEQTFVIAVANLLSALFEQAQRQQVEQQLRQSQKLDAIGQLAGGVAHDFNNLLTVIMSQGIDLQFDEALPDYARTAAAEIVQSSERAANLTRQLLAFSRRQAMRPRAVDLNTVVAELARLLNRLLGEHISLDCRYAPGAVVVRADPSMLDQVVMNLAVNARDAMTSGGSLTMETSIVRIDEDGEPQGASRPGTFVCLRVTDTGSGIAQDVLPHIFEPFFTTKREGQGTGLGLATTYGIVRQHDGWIDVESIVGTGTTFRIYLPHIGTSEAREVAGGGSRDAGETILLVEDDANLRTLIRTRLVENGYNVIEAADAAAATAAFEASRDTIHLLFTDVGLVGETSGILLARRLQKLAPTLQVLYMSGYQGELGGPTALLRGQPNFLTKPFTMAEMAIALRRVLAAQPTE